MKTCRQTITNNFILNWLVLQSLVSFSSLFQQQLYCPGSRSHLSSASLPAPAETNAWGFMIHCKVQVTCALHKTQPPLLNIMTLYNYKVLLNKEIHLLMKNKSQAGVCVDGGHITTEHCVWLQSPVWLDLGKNSTLVKVWERLWWILDWKKTGCWIFWCKRLADMFCINVLLWLFMSIIRISP